MGNILKFDFIKRVVYFLFNGCFISILDFKMEILRIYEERKKDVLDNVRIFSDIYRFHPRESAIRLASAMGNLMVAIRDYELNPDIPVFDYNEWNTKNYDEIIECIVERRGAYNSDDFLGDFSDFDMGIPLDSLSMNESNFEMEKVFFVKKEMNEKRSIFKGLFSKKQKNVKTKSMNKMDIICGVCSEKTDDWKTDCNHTYCDKCAKNWFVDQKKNSCPLCRGKVKVCSSI